MDKVETKTPLNAQIAMVDIIVKATIDAIDQPVFHV